MPKIRLQNWTRGISPRGVEDGVFASTGLDPYHELGIQQAAYSMSNLASSTGISSFNVPVDIIKSGSNAYLMDDIGHLWKGSASDVFASSTSQRHVVSAASTDGGVHIFGGDDHLYYAHNDQIGKGETGFASFTDNWNALPSEGGASTPHSIAEAAGVMAISTENFISTWDGTTWVAKALTLPDAYQIQNIKVLKANALRSFVIHAKNNNDRNEDAIMFWNGTDPTTVTDFQLVPNLQAITVLNNKVYAVAGNDLSVLLWGGSQMEKLTSILGADPTQGSNVSATVNRHAMAPYRNDQILIGVSGRRISGSGTNFIGDRFYPGLWLFDTRSASLMHYLTPSTLNVAALTVKSVYVDSDNGIYMGYSDDTGSIGGATTTERLDKSALSAPSYGSFFISPLMDGNLPEAQKNLTDVIVTTLVTSGGSSDKIISRYRDFSRPLRLGWSQVQSSGTSTTIIGQTTNAIGDVEAGDLVHVTAGPGAGQFRTVSSVSSTTITVSEAWTVTPTTDSCFETLSFKEAGDAIYDMSEEQKDGDDHRIMKTEGHDRFIQTHHEFRGDIRLTDVTIKYSDSDDSKSLR